MNASVYQGESRALPRILTLVMMVQVTILVVGTLLTEHRSFHSPVDPPWILQAPYLFRPLAGALGLLLLWGIVQVGRRRRVLRWGVTVLFVLSYLKESQWALTGYEIRDMYVLGAVFAGWIFGVAWAERLARKLALPPSVARDDAYGEAGATAAFAAVYVGAFTSKLIDSGLDWGEGANLLAAVVGRHQWHHASNWSDAYLDTVLAHPQIATGFALSVMAIQVGMIFYVVSPTLRMILGALVISFHLNAYFLMEVRYFNPALLALAYSFPWPRILRCLRGGAAGPPRSDEALPEVAAAAVAETARWGARTAGIIGVLALVIWLGVHARDHQHLILEQGVLNHGEGQTTQRMGQQGMPPNPSGAPLENPPGQGPSPFSSGH